MKFLQILLVFLGFSQKIVANADTSWKDGNENSWEMVSVKKSYVRAKEACGDLKKRLPSFDEIAEAIDYGLADKSKNEVFGEKVATNEFFWLENRENFQVISVKDGKTSQVKGEERFWTLCLSSKKDENLLRYLIGTWETSSPKYSRRLNFKNDRTVEYTVNGITSLEKKTFKLRANGLVEITGENSGVQIWVIKIVNTDSITIHNLGDKLGTQTWTRQKTK